MAGKKGGNTHGGARPGAGRPRKVVDYDIYDEDNIFTDRYLGSTIIVREMRGRQTRRVKKSRFDMLLDNYARSGLIFKKGHRKDFKEFVAMALATPDEEVYDYRKSRLEYVINQARKAQEEKERAKQPKPKEPWEIEFERAEDERKKLQEILKKQRLSDDVAIARYDRERARYPDRYR